MLYPTFEVVVLLIAEMFEDGRLTALCRWMDKLFKLPHPSNRLHRSNNDCLESKRENNCEDIAQQSCAMVRRWRIFGEFLRPAFSASRVQHVSDLHLKFALRPHHVWKYGIDIQSATAEIRRGKKKKKEDRTNYRAKI